MSEVLWHWSGQAIAILVGAFTLWALFADRAKGRKRCRKCWYDLASLGDVPITCPECGKAHTKPKHLKRTRRRRRLALVGFLVMLVGGYGIWVTPRVIDRGWYGAVPTTGLILAAPWLPRAPLPTNTKGQNLSDSYYQFLLRYQEIDRVMSDNPQSLAEELEIRWNDYSGHWTTHEPLVPDYMKRIGIRWWSLCGAIGDLGMLPSDPSHYSFGNERSIPSILTADEFGYGNLPEKQARTVAGALLLAQQPPVWKISNESYTVDPGAIADSLHFPSKSKITATLLVPSIDHDPKELQLNSTSSFVGGYSKESFAFSDPDSIVVIQYDIQLQSRKDIIRHVITYEIVPWSGPDFHSGDRQWGQAVPRLLNGAIIVPEQKPQRHFQAHVNRHFITNEG